MPTYAHERYDSPAGNTQAVATTHRFSPGQVIGGLAGILFTVVGVVVVTRTGIDSNLNRPVTDILGMTQSAYVGLFELVFGLLMIAASTSIGYRGALGTLGALTLIAGVVIVAASNRIALEIGVSHNTGWFGIILGAVVLVAALLPSIVRSERRVDTY